MTALIEHRYALNRRRLIQALGAAGAAAMAPLAWPALAQVKFASTPFTVGVASGDPASDGFVIWTRLAPDPMELGHGMPKAPVEVEWQVASDEAFTTIVRSGKAVARPELAHAVHVEVAGLLPQRPYWYRFLAGGEMSPVGRAKTTPILGAGARQLRFAVAGCQGYEYGYFTGYRYMSVEDLDFVYHYGDYIYEFHLRPQRQPDGTMADPPRRHVGDEPYSVDEFRRRYAQYKMDPDLQAAHAAHAFFHTWDDHEIEDNWTLETNKDDGPQELFALQKFAAAQAFYENMPLRASAFPRGGDVQLYRRMDWGDLARLSFLDTRQYRTAQPCNDRFGATCPEIGNPRAEVLGQMQERWLMEGVTRSPARWNVLAQQIMMMDLERNVDHGVNPDSWAGYRAPRDRLLRSVEERQVKNLVVLTGDEHKHFAGELHVDSKRPGRQPVGVEFVGTSMSASGNGSDVIADNERMLRMNPQLKLMNSQRGYLVCDVDAQRWQAEMKVLDKVTTPDGTLSTRAKFAVAAGDPRLQPA